jgi:DNA-3-methyladenine glycosylase I
MDTYCHYILSHPEDQTDRHYHNTEYGFPLTDDNLLFERLGLEVNQAGLSRITILKKADNFCRAYDGFNIPTVAAHGEAERARLLADAGIIRNRLKVNAAIVDTGRILELQKGVSLFKNWLDAHHQDRKKSL